MMWGVTVSIIGQVCTSRGLCQQIDGLGQPEPYETPANRFFRSQPNPIPIHVNHQKDWKLGEVVHLERSQTTGLLAVAVLDADVEDYLRDHEWHFSDGISCRSSGVLGMDKIGIKLRELSLVAKTGNLGTRPIYASRGDIAQGTAGAPAGLPLRWHDAWKRAGERSSLARYRRRPESMEIHDVDRLSIVDEALTDPHGDIARMWIGSPPPAPVLPKARATSEAYGGKVFRHSYPATLVMVDAEG